MAIAVSLIGLHQPIDARAEQPSSFEALAREYQRDALPLLKQFCWTCHSSKKKKGDLDLESFATLASARRGVKVWIKVVENLDNGEMPPRDSAQPSAGQRKQLRGWVKRFLHAEAIDRAGDPGPVVLRRLTNAEYAYTIRDLTKVDLNPAREFPTEGAAGEGFTNTGNALVMSPGLLRKYLEAGKEIADHVVLLPDGFRFSAHVSRADLTNDILAEIRAFYGGFGETVKLPAYYNPSFTHMGRAGRLPLARYFAATLVERESLARGDKTIDAVANAHRLNPRYLGLLWATLTAKKPSALLDDLRTRWRAAKPADAAKLAAHVETWQKGLWTFNPVGLLGKKGSRSRWLEAVVPLLSQHELRFKIATPKKEEEKADLVVSFVATAAGDGHENDIIIWKQPRVVVEGKPDVLLRDVQGVDSKLFGKHVSGEAIAADSLCVQAPSSIAFRLPVEFAGRELVTTAVLDPKAAEGSVQPEIVSGVAEPTGELLPIEFKVAFAKLNIGADQRTIDYRRPILVGAKSKARARFQSAMDDFRGVFPAALSYTQIVPVDEALTLTLFHREDDQLARLLLDQAQRDRLDKLWRELRYVSREPLRLVDVLDSLLETTIDHPQAGVFEPLVKPFNERAQRFRKMVAASEARHLDALIAFTARAWRRPIASGEETELRGLYRRLRDLDLPHDKAFRLTLARVFVASPFLYRLEQAAEGNKAAAVSSWELASRLSYFLWSSAPDDELRAAAANGSLRDPTVLARQTRRLLKDARVRRLAAEFACQWLHVHEFSARESKSEKHFPEFAQLRGDMHEEAIRFFTDLCQNDGSVLSLLDADHTFLNERLARFYGVDGVEGAAWRRVDGVRQHGRGGILGLAATLAKQSGATRTSPILRGNWVSEVLLGEMLPRPPNNVPQLADKIPTGLTERQLIERHSSDASCAKCHKRIDPFGFALEGFDAIGRLRQKDASGLAIDSRTTLPDGARIEGLAGLREYLLGTRRDAFVRQFCGKLLGYAIGRELQLSDEPLLDEMMTRLAKNNYRFSVAVETICLSKQFRRIRGQSFGR